MKKHRFAFIRRAALLLALTASSAVAQSTPGQIGNALSFDGIDDWVKIPETSPPTYHFGSMYADRTVEAWIRVDDLAPGKTHAVFSMGDAQQIIFRVIVKDDGRLHCGVRYERTWQNYVYKPIETSPGAIVEGQWHHVAARVSQDRQRGNQFFEVEMALLLDGVEVKRVSDQTDGFYYLNVNQLGIGKELVGGYYFDGAIDEVRFWSDGRSAGEIANNMHSALTGSEANLIGYWPLDEGDTTPPVVVLNGEAEMTIDQPYVDPGATATDPTSNLVVADAGPYANDGNYNGVIPVPVPVTITGSVGSNPATYTVTYTAADASGNTATADRLVHVECFLYDWEQMPGSAVDIAFGGNGDLWMTGGIGFAGGYQVFRWEADNWVPVQAGAQRIGVAPNGIPWIVLNNGLILRKDSDPTSTAWYPVPDAGAGGAIDIGMGGPGNGEVWVVAEHTSGGDHAAFRWNPAASSWDATGGYTGKAIDVAPDGSAWMRLDDGRILAFHAGASDWAGMPGDDVVDVALGYDGSAWCVADDGEVRRWNASSYGWEKVSGTGKAISVSPNGIPWVVREDGSIWRGQPVGSNQ